MGEAGRISAREAAYRSLIRCENDKSYTNLEIDAKIKKFGLEGAERSLFTILVYGVTERRITLDFRLSPCVTGGVGRLSPEVLTVLRLGAYQTLYLDRVPDSAAVNESVELARRHCPAGSYKLVNAVLRELCRKKNDPPPLPGDPVAAAEVEYGVPRGLIGLWISSYGEDKTKEILEALSVRPPVTVRANTLKTTPEELAERLGGAAGPVPGSLILKSGTAPEELRLAIGEGLCYVQDASSQEAVALLGPRPGMTLVDTCCCPGGKSFAAALMMENSGVIRAFDLHQNKLSLVTGTAARLGVDIIAADARDARQPDPALAGRADRVICDVPCSGLGVIAKKPEIRYKDLSDIKNLPDLQYDILCASASYLKPGGRLLYSTCTLNKAENEEVAARFLDGSPDFSLVEQRTFFPSAANDGFFACVMEKK